MSFERQETLPKFLSSLSQIALEHTQATGMPAHFEFAVSSGESGSVAFFEPDGSAVRHTEAEPPVAPSPEVDFVLTETQATQETMDDGSYSVQSFADGTVTATFTPAASVADEPDADPGDLSAVAAAPTNALALLDALRKHGNNGGYDANELDEAAEELGITLPPEVRFYRANSFPGNKVADGPNGDVIASDLVAVFGPSAGDGALPAARPTDIVQPLRSHEMWIEIAHDTSIHYAADFAPGAAGALGQVIGRDNASGNPPQLVARSLTEFVKGEWVDEETAAASWTPSIIVAADPTTWQLTADDFEGIPRFIHLAEEEQETPVVNAPIAETTGQDDAAQVPAVAETSAVDTDLPDEDYSPISSLMTGSDAGFSDVVASDEVLVAQTSTEPAPIVPIAETEKPAEPTEQPQKPAVAEEKPKVPRKAKKRAQRVSFEVSSSDFSAEPSAMSDDFIEAAHVIDSNDLKGFDEEEIAKQSSPISPEGDPEAEPNNIFAVNKINRQATPPHRNPSERSSQDIAQDFATVAFSNPYEDDEDEDYYDNRREGGLRKALRRFFG